MKNKKTNQEKMFCSIKTKKGGIMLGKNIIEKITEEIIIEKEQEEKEENYYRDSPGYNDHSGDDDHNKSN